MFRFKMFQRDNSRTQIGVRPSILSWLFFALVVGLVVGYLAFKMTNDSNIAQLAFAISILIINKGFEGIIRKDVKYDDIELKIDSEKDKSFICKSVESLTHEQTWNLDCNDKNFFRCKAYITDTEDFLRNLNTANLWALVIAILTATAVVFGALDSAALDNSTNAGNSSLNPSAWLTILLLPIVNMWVPALFFSSRNAQV